MHSLTDATAGQQSECHHVFNNSTSSNPGKPHRSVRCSTHSPILPIHCISGICHACKRSEPCWLPHRKSSNCAGRHLHHGIPVWSVEQIFCCSPSSLLIKTRDRYADIDVKHCVMAGTQKCSMREPLCSPSPQSVNAVSALTPVNHRHVLCSRIPFKSAC